MNTQLHNGLELALICRLPADVVAGTSVSLNDVRVTVDRIEVVDGVRVGVVGVSPVVVPTLVAVLQNTQVVLDVNKVVRLVADVVVVDARKVSDVFVRSVLRAVVPQVDVVDVVVLSVREVDVSPVPATNLDPQVVSGVSVRLAS